MRILGIDPLNSSSSNKSNSKDMSPVQRLKIRRIVPSELLATDK
jgi:hypothetical protein